jgi:hypothetical protein
MSVNRKHFIRRLSRLTGIPAKRIGLASRRLALTDIAKHVYARVPVPA